MPYVQRDASGSVVGVFAWPQPDMPEELLADNDPEVLAYYNKPVITELARTNRRATLDRQMDAAAARGDAAAVLNLSRRLLEI